MLFQDDLNGGSHFLRLLEPQELDSGLEFLVVAFWAFLAVARAQGVVDGADGRRAAEVAVQGEAGWERGGEGPDSGRFGVAELED